MQKLLLASIAALGLAGLGSTANAQTLPNGEELHGHTVDVVFVDGKRNAILFDRNGTATVSSPDGHSASGTWNVQGNRLCLVVAGGNECWTYARRFNAGETLTLTSSCQSTSQWTPRSVNPERRAPIIKQGERG